MRSGLPSGTTESPRANDWGLGPYDSGAEDPQDLEHDAPVVALPSPSPPSHSYDFYAASRLPKDDDVPTARADYYDSLYVGQGVVENLEIQDNGLFGQTIGDLSDAVPPDPYEAGVLSSVIQTLFESDGWSTEPEIRICAADLYSVLLILRR